MRKEGFAVLAGLSTNDSNKEEGMEFGGMRRLVADMLFDREVVLDKQRSFGGRPVRAGEQPDGLGFRLHLHEKHPDAPLAPFYFNFRTADNPNPGPLDEHDLLFIGIVMCLRSLEALVSYDAVAGIPHAGDPIADAFARSVYAIKRKPVPVLRLAKGETADGRRVIGLRDGMLPGAGARVLLIDDVCTGGGSLLEAIGVLEAAGYKVRDVLVLVDRGRGGGEELLRLGYHLHAVFSAHGLFRHYYDTGVIRRKVFEEIVEYLDSSDSPKRGSL